jgi:tight adherence protein B
VTAGLLAGCLTALVLSACRIRPDHRLRGPTPVPATRPTWRPRWPRRSRHPGPAELAAWCDALAREVRSGVSLGAALRSVPAPDDTVLVAIRHGLARGLPLADAVAVPAATADEQAVLTVLAACAHHGGAAARPLDQVAATLRRRAADAAERSVHSAQARLSALVMTVLPGGVLVLLLATSPSVRTITASPMGAVVVTSGLLLNALGWTWMRRIIMRRHS